MFEQARNSACLDAFPVHLACRDGDVQSLTKFVWVREEKSHLLAEDTFYHWTPIHWASFFGQLPALIVLREAGVGVDVTTARFQQTAAHIAAFAGADHCLKYLVHFGCNVNKQDYLGETPLHKAARAGSVACGSVLAADGRALPHVLNSSGQTPATLAAACGHALMAAYLAEYERHVRQQTGVCAPAVRAAGCGRTGPRADHPALNGGLVPQRTEAAAGPRCYQPPQRHLAHHHQMDADASGERQNGPAAVGLQENGHFIVRHSSGGHPDAGCRDDVHFSASVGHQGNGDFSVDCQGNDDFSAGRQGNGFRKRGRDEVFFEEIKRRRLVEYTEPSSGLSVPYELGLTAAVPAIPADQCGRGQRQEHNTPRHLA